MSTKRSEGWKRIVRDERGYAYCKAGCGTVCPTKARLYCSEACSVDYSIRNFPAFARQMVFARDHGVCALCGLDTVALGRRWDKAQRDASAFAYGRKTPEPGQERVDRHAEMRAYGGNGTALWEMDHIIPVVEGGGQCGLDGLRTLCSPCHRMQTNELRFRLGRAKREARAAEIAARQPALFSLAAKSL